MVEALRPELVGHFDLPPLQRARTRPQSAVRAACREDALAALARRGALLKVNTAGYRKGLGPYPDRG
jgi:hypothetical protein